MVGDVKEMFTSLTKRMDSDKVEPKQQLQQRSLVHGLLQERGCQAIATKKEAAFKILKRGVNHIEAEVDR